MCWHDPGLGLALHPTDTLFYLGYFIKSANCIYLSISSPGLRMEISHQTVMAHKVDPSRALSSALRLQRVRDLPDCDFIPGSLQTSSLPCWGRRGLQKAVKPCLWQARQGRSLPTDDLCYRMSQRCRWQSGKSGHLKLGNMSHLQWFEVGSK